MKHLAKMNKSIESVDQFQMRAALFAKTDKIIQEHNQSGLHTYWLGHNLFSDLTQAEKDKYLVSNMNQLLQQQVSTQKFEPLDTNAVPEAINWVSKDGGNCMAPIKNQGTCGACWTFSATGTLESLQCISEGAAEGDLI